MICKTRPKIDCQAINSMSEYQHTDFWLYSVEDPHPERQGSLAELQHNANPSVWLLDRGGKSSTARDLFAVSSRISTLTLIPRGKHSWVLTRTLWWAVLLMFKYPRQAGKDVPPLTENKSVFVAAVFVVSHWRKMCSHSACVFMTLLSGRWLNLWIFPCSWTSLFQHLAKLWKANISHAMFETSPIHKFAKCSPTTFPKSLTEKSKSPDENVLLLVWNKTTHKHQTELMINWRWLIDKFMYCFIEGEKVKKC